VRFTNRRDYWASAEVQGGRRTTVGSAPLEVTPAGGVPFTAAEHGRPVVAVPVFKGDVVAPAIRRRRWGRMRFASRPGPYVGR
jgi:hypothetical protein